MEREVIFLHIGGAGISSADNIWKNFQMECRVNDY
jgi:hypothetical protein